MVQSVNGLASVPKVMFLAFTLFAAISATLAGVLVNSMVVEQKRSEVEVSGHGARLSALEAFNAGVRDDLTRIDSKLDRLLERVTR